MSQTQAKPDPKASPYPPNLQLPDPQQLAENFTRIAEQSQRLVKAYLERQAEQDNFSIPDRRVVAEAFLTFNQQLLANPLKLAQLQTQFFKEVLDLWQNAYQRMWGQEVSPLVAPEAGDKRFKADEWAENAVFDYIKQSYLLVARTLHRAVQEVDGLDPKTAEKVEFYTRQFVDSFAPTNFALSNPTVLKHTMETGGENLVRGLAHLLDDLERGRGELRIRQTDLEAFELGQNIAVTPGKVVFQNDLIQLLQYTPTTEEVFKTPLMIVPPWINKFYILDLKPKNSFIKWAVDQGFTVFVLSWVNPDERLADKDFEDYLKEGPLAALDVIKDITGEETVNAIGYCLGGTLLGSALAYLTAQGQASRISSATCFTCLWDFSDPGELGVFIDEKQVGLVEEYMNGKGYLEGSRMAHVFSMLRANDLIWSFVVNNYLMGKEPMAFDLLFWNSDSTRMPRAMHSTYLRKMYLENRLAQVGGITLLDTPIDLHQVKTPVFFLSTREDHIAPWKSTYKGALLPAGPVRFVLGGSGHIAGVINPAGSKKYGFWTADQLEADPDAWLAKAQAFEGSWWPYWLNWITPMAGEKVPARTPGNTQYPPLEDAPGSYVKVRIG